MLKGYTGKIMHIDLTLEKIWIESPTEQFYRQYFGGSSMGLYYILKECPSTVHGLDPSNILTFMLSGPTGAAISGQSRMCANARSPLTDGIGDAQCGGFFPAEMKFSGFDGIVFKGRASHPIYVWIKDGKVELRDASHLWGQTVSKVDQMLKSELEDEKVEIAQCGPSAEIGSCLAAIINMGNRANGRTGLGAVMASKNLKAVVVRGTSKRLPVADPKKINQLARWGADEIPNNADVKGLQLFGTASVVSFQNMIGSLPTNNYDQGQFAAFEKISGETMSDTILKENDTCYACSVRCKRVIEAEWASHKIEPKFGGPEYETIGTFGSYCGIDDLPAIGLANKICNEYGLDTIGTGATIAWAMDCNENGILTEKEIGFPLKFGDASAMIRILEMLAKREGFGDILADGSLKASARLQKGEELLITCKGSEAPAHMPQAKRSLELIYAVNAFGADHQSSEHDPMIEEGASDLCLSRLALIGCDKVLAPGSFDGDKVIYALKTQIFYSFLDVACLCQFVWGPAWTLFGPTETVDMVKAVTGWDDFSVEELMEIGERRLNMLKIFNTRLGLTRDHDILPKKFYKALNGSGPTAGIKLDKKELEKAKDLYYSMLGWNQDTGSPNSKRLEELGLEWTV